MDGSIGSDKSWQRSYLYHQYSGSLQCNCRQYHYNLSKSASANNSSYQSDTNRNSDQHSSVRRHTSNRNRYTKSGRNV